MSECLKPTNCKAKSLVAKCGSVSSKFAYLMQTKEMMRNMLIQKGQDVPKDLPLRDYVEKIAVLLDPADAVSSIIDYTGTPHKGDVTVDKTFIGLSNVDNTADIDKPISTATQEALDLKQNITDDSLETEAKTIVGAINEINTSNSGKQDSSITIDGITANTVEGALVELATDISALQNKTQNINQASSGFTQFTGTVQADTFLGTTISGQTLTAGNQLTVNGSVTGSAIQTTLNASSTDQQLPSAKAVYDGLAAKQDALTYYEESTAGNGSVTIGATTQAGTYPSAVTVASSTIRVQLTTSTLDTINTNGGILNRETAFKSTSQTGSIDIAEFTNLARCKVVFDTIASEGGAKSRTIFEYDATNNVWYREVIFGTGASITSMIGGTVNYDLGVAVSSANIVVSML